MTVSNERSNELDFVWRARVTCAAPHRADVHVRRHHFVVGKPVEFDVASEAVSAIEYLLGALGADLVNGMRAVARRRRVAIDRIEAAVEGSLDNPLTHLSVIGETGHAGLARASVKMYVSSLDSESEVRAAWNETIERSPIVRTLRDAVKLELILNLSA